MNSAATNRTRRRRGLLDRTAIVEAAIAVADRDGLDNLTMRRVADELGYKVMALYNHVDNKDELLGLMVDMVAGEVASPASDVAPLQAVRAVAVSLREMLVHHVWAAEVWLGHVPGPNRTRVMENVLAALAASDLSPKIAHYGFHAVTNHVVGYTLQEIGMAAGLSSTSTEDPEQIARRFIDQLEPAQFEHTIAHVQQHLDGESGSSFEFVLDLILDGLVRVDQP